eukprot:10113790-Karenia_brevis.AAC.1
MLILQQVGVKVEGMQVDSEVQLPATAQAQKELQDIQNLHDASLESLGPDHAATKGLKAQLENFQHKSSNLAQ